MERTDLWFYFGLKKLKVILKLEKLINGNIEIFSNHNFQFSNLNRSVGSYSKEVIKDKATKSAGAPNRGLLGCTQLRFKKTAPLFLKVLILTHNAGLFLSSAPRPKQFRPLVYSLAFLQLTYRNKNMNNNLKNGLVLSDNMKNAW